MHVYLYIITLFSLLAYFIDLVKSKKQKQFIFSMYCMLLAYFLGSRYGAGHDYFNYEKTYESIAIITQNIPTFSSPLFFSLYELSNYLSLPFTVALSIFSLITIYQCLYRSMTRNELLYSFIFLFLSGYIFFINNQIKQALVSATFIFSLYYLEKRNFWKYFSLIILSSISFHPSGIFLVLCYFITEKKIDYKFYLLACISGLIVVTKFDVYTQYVDLIKSLPLYGEKYATRFDKTIQHVGSGLTILYHIIIATVVCKFYSGNYKRGVNIYLIGVLLYIIFINSEFLERFFFYFIYLSFLFFPNIIKNKKSITSWFIVFFTIILMIVNFIAEAAYNYGKHGASGITWMFEL
ncbi:EpsG family protein [Providencia huaxiensis]|uniref:EpsG family protein n=1 Tax=Providencia rettgeri TaxID=587 RepID=A0AAD2VU42_PRORE|nr:EpsG family protein [Providencia rettgeri]